MNEIGMRLRDMRESRGLSQKSLGKAIQLSQREVSYLENGKRTPSLETITSLVNYFHRGTKQPILAKEWEGFIYSFIGDTLGTVAEGVGLGITLQKRIGKDRYDMVLNLEDGTPIAVDIKLPSSRKVFKPNNVKFLSSLLSSSDEKQQAFLRLLESPEKWPLLKLVDALPTEKVSWLVTVLEGIIRK
jgi:transcriptional regulator with XRE-family HTH domain